MFHCFIVMYSLHSLPAAGHVDDGVLFYRSFVSSDLAPSGHQENPEPRTSSFDLFGACVWVTFKIGGVPPG